MENNIFPIKTLHLGGQQINLYAYCLNNSVYMIAPDGKTPIRIGKHTIEATFDVNTIHLSLRKGDAKSMIMKNPFSAISIASTLKTEYKKKIGSDIGISTRSMVFEILGHAIPDVYATTVSNNGYEWGFFNKKLTGVMKEVADRTSVVDIGNWEADSNRWVWDLFSYSHSMDTLRNIKWVLLER